MSEKNLLKARVYECLIDELEGDNLKADRPAYHAAPRVGWMNDPNGFSYYKGDYHLFYQYYPYEKQWGPMHWGHLKSSDLLHWEHLPAVLAPDHAYDLEGCWSGSAIEMKDGRQMLIYTGRQPETVSDEDGNREPGKIRQVQCLAFGDGLNYQKYDGNPVIDSADLPQGASDLDFRDPKIWWDQEDQCFYVIIGSRGPEGQGQILMFSSPDGLHWTYDSTLAVNDGGIGSMWECPDFFLINDKAFLLVSPQEMCGQAGNQNVHGNVVISGTYDRKTHQFQKGEARPIDRGYDFYASQTMDAPDGRKIMIAWMQAWENTGDRKEDDRSWFGMMTLPRELSERDGRLIQRPVREIESLRCNGYQLNGLTMSGRMSLPEVHGRVLDLQVKVQSESPGSYDRFEIRLAEGENFSTVLVYEPVSGTVTYDRTNSGHGPDRLPPRRLQMDHPSEEIRFRILMDKYSVEIFINDGEEVITSTMLTPEQIDGISFYSLGRTAVDIEKYDLI